MRKIKYLLPMAMSLYGTLILAESPNPKDQGKKHKQESGAAEVKKDEKKMEKTDMTKEPEKTQTVTELKIEDVKPGSGKEVQSGDKISVHYVGKLENGKQFDSSYDRNTPLDVVIGKGLVIKGWDKGLLGMKEGGVRKLTIPPDLAYGNRAVGGVIPANSTLVFEVKLLSVENP